MLPYATVSLICLLFLLGLYNLRKVREAHLLLSLVHDQSYRQPATLFRQLEALQGLYVELALRRSLPDTRGWAASPDFLLELVRHARAVTPLTVVECSSGTSTLVLARCMQLNGAGKVYSLEHDLQYAEQTRQQLRLHGLQGWAEVLYAPLLPHELDDEHWPWYGLAEVPAGDIDMLVIDGPPQGTRPRARYPAGPLLFPRLSDNGAVFLDDADRADEQAILQRWQQDHPELLRSARLCEKGCAVLQRRAR